SKQTQAEQTCELVCQNPSILLLRGESYWGAFSAVEGPGDGSCYRGGHCSWRGGLYYRSRVGNISFLSSSDVRRGLGCWPAGRIRRRGFVYRRVVPQRYSQWRYLSFSGHSCLECDYAFHILCSGSLVTDCIPTFSLSLGANRRPANVRVEG